MAEQPKSRPPQGAAQTTPEGYPTSPSPQHLPSGDYSYTVEVVGTINHALGKLTEAVETLKEQSREHGKELKQIGRDIHAAKMVGGFLIAAAGLVGWVVHEVISYLASHPPK